MIRILSVKQCIPVINSFFKICTVETYLPDDIVETAGYLPQRFYMFLEGEAEHISLDAKVSKKIALGDFFGCIETNSKNYSTIKIIKISKIAYIQKTDFILFKDAYPKWYQ